MFYGEYTLGCTHKTFPSLPSRLRSHSPPHPATTLPHPRILLQCTLKAPRTSPAGITNRRQPLQTHSKDLLNRGLRHGHSSNHSQAHTLPAGLGWAGQVHSGCPSGCPCQRPSDATQCPRGAPVQIGEGGSEGALSRALLPCGPLGPSGPLGCEVAAAVLIETKPKVNPKAGRADAGLLARVTPRSLHPDRQTAL